jgi:hypothetical protein
MDKQAKLKFLLLAFLSTVVTAAATAIAMEETSDGRKRKRPGRSNRYGRPNYWNSIVDGKGFQNSF